MVALVLGLCASLGVLGCSPSEVAGLRSYLQFLESSPAGGETSCLEGTPVLSEIVEPEAVLRWEPTVCAVFDPVDASTALCIISYESGGDPGSTNPDDPGRGSFGLMQINSDWWIGSEYHERMVKWFGRDDETYLDPAVNISAAALLVNDPDLSGWHSWASSKICPHRHHEHSA
ncbi:MAG: transglycosylase SLT domain-containing protein [bacterium]|nr:transglycosylase SLT domain-containing protein [bacterium]